MKEFKSNDIMQMFAGKNVVNRADFTFEEYVEQLTNFQEIVSSCVFDGDDSYRLSDSVTRLEELVRSKGIKNDPFVHKALNDLRETQKELAIIMAGKKGEGRIENALSYVKRPDVTMFKNVYITDGEEETEIDTVLVTNSGIIFLEIKNAKQDITIAEDGRLLYENETSHHNTAIGEKMEKKRRLLKYYIEKEMRSRGIYSIGKPVRIESRIVFSTPYNTRINVTDLYRKERYCYRSQLTKQINNYYSGTYYDDEDLQLFNNIIGSMESNKKRFQQKLDFAKINSDFARLMEMLSKPETIESETVSSQAPSKTKVQNPTKTKTHQKQHNIQRFGKIAIPVASVALVLASFVSSAAISKRY